MDFRFGCAKGLYQRNIHPRVLFGPKDVVRLRGLVRKGDARKIMQALRARVKSPVEWLLGCDDVGAAFAAVDIPRGTSAYAASGAAREIATVAVIDENADCAEALARLFGNTEWVDFRGRLSLPSPVAYDIVHDSLPESVRESYCKLVVGDLKRRVTEAGPDYYRRSGHNISLGAGVGALWGLLAVKGDAGVPDLSEEQAELVRMLEATLHVVYNVDGYPEEDVGYGTSVGAHMSQLAESLRRAGIYDPYEACPRYALFGRALLHFVQPWGEYLSNTGDHGDDFGQREFVLARLAAETKDPTLTWLLGTLSYGAGEIELRRGFQAPASTLSLIALPDAPKAVHPRRAGVPTQFRDRGRGIVSLRSGWREDDTLVVFDGSQRSSSAQGHSHASCGHFSISALGEYFAIDTGRYNIEQNCHNVVLVDGKSGRSTDGEWVYTKQHGRLTDYVPGEFVDFVAVDSSHQHNCYWAYRSLGLVKGARGAPAYVWTVEDINKANDHGEYWWQLHTSPENVIRAKKDSAAIRGYRHGNWMDVRWVLPDPDEYPEPHRLLEVTQDEATPSSYKYIPNPRERAKEAPRPAAMVHHAGYLRPRLIAKVSGLNGRFMSLMVPRRKGERPARIQRLAAVPNSLAARITFAAVEDTVIVAYDHQLLEADDVAGRGRWCVVRRSRASGKVLAHALGDGTSLTVGGRKLR